MKSLIALLLFPIAAAAGVVSDPFTDTPISISGIPGSVTIWEAENFDKGGEAVAYHKIVLGGNASSPYRPAEDVNIKVSPDVAYGSSYVVFNFRAGEWLTYTIQVKETAAYTLELRAASANAANLAAGTHASYHIEVDGINVDPSKQSIIVDQTADWSTYVWTGKSSEFVLSPGVHVLKIVVDQQPFDTNAIRMKYSSDISWECRPVLRRFP